MAEKANDVVIDVKNEFVAQGDALRSRVRKAFLVSLGAAAMAADEANNVVNKLAERGESAEGELQTMLDECRVKLRRLPDEGQRVGESISEGVEAFIDRFGPSSNRDEIARLNEQINQLNEKIAALAQD